MPMNKRQRKQLNELSEQLGDIQCEVEQIRDDEQEKIDNLPDGLQGSATEDKYQEGIDALEEIISAIEDAKDKFSEIP